MKNELEETKSSKRAMPFAWIALISSILMTFWTCFWAIPFFGMPSSCTGTSCGESSAWTLILGTGGSLLLGTLALSFGLLGKDLKAEDDHRKKLILSITVYFAIPSVLLLIIAFIFTTSHTH